MVLGGHQRSLRGWKCQQVRKSGFQEVETLNRRYLIPKARTFVSAKCQITVTKPSSKAFSERHNFRQKAVLLVHLWNGKPSEAAFLFEWENAAANLDSLELRKQVPSKCRCFKTIKTGGLFLELNKICSQRDQRQCLGTTFPRQRNRSSCCVVRIYDQSLRLVGDFTAQSK